MGKNVVPSSLFFRMTIHCTLSLSQTTITSITIGIVVILSSTLVYVCLRRPSELVGLCLF